MEKTATPTAATPPYRARSGFAIFAICALATITGLNTRWGDLLSVWKQELSTLIPLLDQAVGSEIDISATTSSDHPYGRFPLPNDPFKFLPCTNATLPPPLDDSNALESWAASFNPNPDHWSWGNRKSSNFSDDEYSGRGIYLCGYLDLPLDYHNETDDRIVRLAVTKFQVAGLARINALRPRISSPAGCKSDRTIVVEPGGPGDSGTAYVWEVAEKVSERFSDGQFDVFGWDPRGVNISLPSLACFPDDLSRDYWSLLSRQYRESTASMVQLEIADAINNATFYSCKRRFGDFGRFISTATVARDLEAIRKALDEDQLTGYFTSYGTGIGQTYANMFPDRVGRMILDGPEYVKDHRLLAGFGWTSLDNVTGAWREGFLGECLKAGPDYCALAKPTSVHDAPATLDQLEARMATLIRSLIARPVSGYTEHSGPFLVTYSGLVQSIYVSLYDVSTWPAIAQMLYELERGNSTLAAAFLVRSWETDSGQSLSYQKTTSRELPYLVICADAFDAPQPVEGLIWWERLWNNMTNESWIAGNSRFFTVLPCRHFNTYWSSPAEVYRGDLNHTLQNPVLLIAGPYDPATPLRNGRRLFEEMGVDNARLIIHHGFGHTSRWDTSNCTDSLGKEYILKGRLPVDGETHCFANQMPYLAGVSR